MFPFTYTGSAYKRAASAGTRTAEQAAKEMEELGRLAEAESTFDGVLLSSDDRLAKGRIAKSVREAASPEGMLELTRVWREVDKVMGPGKSVLHTLIARYPRLQGAAERMTALLRRGVRARSGAARGVVMAELEAELKAFAGVKDEILSAAQSNAAAIKETLQAELAGEDFRKLRFLSKAEVKEECAAALQEMEQSFLAMKKAAAKGADGRPGKLALKKIDEEKVLHLRKGPSVGEREALGSRVRALAEKVGDPMEHGPEFAAQIKRKAGRYLPPLEDIEDTSLVFMEGLGLVAQAKPENAGILRRYVEQGKDSLKPKEMEKVTGFLGQMKGLLPEEVATNMKFMEGVFYKEAFAALDAFPPELRGKISVEMVHGPLWVMPPKGPPRQFGDGCMLLVGPRGQVAIVGLGEFKAGFDADLMEQLIARSDGRALDATVRFMGADGEARIARLTREFAFDGGEKVALARPPTYVYGRPAGESVETAEAFKEMVEEGMASGREMWKMQLPFTSAANERFAEDALKLAVKTLKKADPKWGR